MHGLAHWLKKKKKLWEADRDMASDGVWMNNITNFKTNTSLSITNSLIHDKNKV